MMGRPVFMPAKAAAAPQPAPALHAASAPQHAPVPQAMMVNPAIRADLMRARMQQMGASATACATTTKHFTLSFDYCLVSATRPWLSGSLLTAGNWYVPHMPAGQIASGSGQGAGVFEALPMAALMVRNLVIEGDWSDADREAMQASLNFGPFSLMGRSIDTVTSTLSAPGMQLVAWVLEPLPCLPPIADPALSASPSAPATASAATGAAPSSLAAVAAAPAPVADTPASSGPVVAMPVPAVPAASQGATAA